MAKTAGEKGLGKGSVAIMAKRAEMRQKMISLHALNSAIRCHALRPVGFHKKIK